MSEVERKRSAKKLFERACKLERGYNYLFTDVIRLDEDDWLLKVHTTISDQQNGLVWVSEKVGSACEDDDSEYDEHNDDRNVFFYFAYFFVPMKLLLQDLCIFWTDDYARTESCLSNDITIIDFDAYKKFKYLI